MKSLVAVKLVFLQRALAAHALVVAGNTQRRSSWHSTTTTTIAATRPRRTFVRLALSDPYSSFSSSSSSSSDDWEKEAALQQYLASVNEETVRTLLELEEQKEAEIRALQTRLLHDLNAALREKELQALRYQLDRLRQMVQGRLELQASLEELKSNELQDLKIKLNQLLDQAAAKGQSSSSALSSSASPSSSGSLQQDGVRNMRQNPGSTSNGAVKAKNGAQATKSGTPKAAKPKPPQKNGVAAAAKAGATTSSSSPQKAKSAQAGATSPTKSQKSDVPVGRKTPITAPIIKPVPPKKNGVEKKNTVKLGPFKNRD